tara:strand:+ start:9154 stop:10611 length:1458 start_codon:yes stop_codon:yes gene_type:complete
MRETPLRGREISAGEKPRKTGLIWTGVVLFLLLLVTCTGALIFSARKCESPEFRAAITRQLSEQLEADVYISPLNSHSLVFLNTSDVWIASKAGKWAVHLENLALELDLRSLLSPTWKLRSSQVRNLNVWLGNAPRQAREEAAASYFSPDVLQNIAESRVIPFTISIPSIRAANLMVEGPSYGNRAPSFSVDTKAKGSFSDGVLNWEIQNGELKLGGGEPWHLDELVGAVSEVGWKLENGKVSRKDGSEILIRPVATDGASHELTAEVEARGIKLGLQSGIKTTTNPVKQVAIDAKGKFVARFPELHRFRFLGGFQLTGLEMSDWRMFKLISSQTGDGRLANLESDWANGEIEWTPGLVRLNQIVFEETELVRMQGRVSIVGSELAGVVDLALPAPVVGRFPGGKPGGFSYPAAGWSWAQIRLTGTLDDWREDLTQRLLEEIDPNVAVETTLTPVNADAAKWDATELSESQADLLEKIFHKLLDH